MTRLGKVKTAEAAIEFLEEAARYFEQRPTGGEDRAYWANVYNAENSRIVAVLLREHDGLERALRVRIWNECKERGMRDEDAYKRIDAAIEAVKTEARAASADTHPKDGDVEQAPLVSGAVSKGETPNG